MKEALDRYSDILIGLDLIRQEKEQLKEQVLTPEQKQALADIEAEFEPRSNALQQELEVLAESVKAYVLERGETLAGTYHQAVYTKGRVSWDTKVLTRIAEFIPEVELARSEGKPSVSIRARK